MQDVSQFWNPIFFGAFIQIGKEWQNWLFEKLNSLLELYKLQIPSGIMPLNLLESSNNVFIAKRLPILFGISPVKALLEISNLINEHSLPALQLDCMEFCVL